MIDCEAARALAQASADSRQPIHPVDTTETREGWYFPFAPRDEMRVGSNGMIVNKKTGRVYGLGSAFTVERDLEMYDLGFQFECYDLVILSISELKQTVRVLLELCPTSTTPVYEHGTVWRIPRSLTRDEVESQLNSVPATFPEIQLYFHLESLVRAQEHSYFEFRVLEFRTPANKALNADVE